MPNGPSEQLDMSDMNTEQEKREAALVDLAVSHAFFRWRQDTNARAVVTLIKNMDEDVYKAFLDRCRVYQRSLAQSLKDGKHVRTAEEVSNRIVELIEGGTWGAARNALSSTNDYIFALVMEKLDVT